MPRALNCLRSSPHYRRDAFTRGLQAAGLDVVQALPRPAKGDLLLCWNRYGAMDEQAAHFERSGGVVLVVENCPFGNSWRSGAWYSLARGQTAMAGGELVEGGPERWDGWCVALRQWQEGELVILGQRSIGNSGTASPPGWAERMQRAHGGRVRSHPGNEPAKVPLADDLRKAGEVLTWCSAAAIQALALGVAAWHAHPGFLAAQAARPIRERGLVAPLRSDEARLRTMRRAAWAIWSLDEIQTGLPIRRLL